MDVSGRHLLETSAHELQHSIFGFDLHSKAVGSNKIGALESVYVPMRDGVKIALDIVRPLGDGPNTKRGTVLVMTRYWRGVKGDPTNPFAELFVPHGYAVVVGDVRGTGASFGVWRHHYSRAEILDFSDVLDWIVAQPWSTGGVVGYGHSYVGTTAAFMAERNHPALRGTMPSGREIDPYEENYFPGGIRNDSQGKTWGISVKYQDSNVFAKVEVTGAITIIPSPGVRPVGPDGEADLQAALRDHDTAPSEWEGQQQVTFKDDRPTTWGGESWRDSSLMEVADRISRSGTPTQDYTGWFDGGLSQGALRRFVLQANPISEIIGPWGHSHEIPYDPLRAESEAIFPTKETLEANRIRFAELCLNGQAAREQGKVLHYYTLGEGWKTTRLWPLPGTTRQRWYMASDSRLSASPDRTGFDSLQVDRATGALTSVWWNRPEMDFGDLRNSGAGRLTYTSEALTRDVEITGQPVVHLNVTSTREDGAFFLYLHGIKPDGEPYYLTRGQLRALHRKIWTDSPFSALGPDHTYLRRDAEPLTPGDSAILTFTLFPMSARIPAGHRLKVIVAGSDAPTFASVPADGEPPFLKFHHGPAGCYIDLPIIEP
ncbi:CocE/NonD family hydrolase [Mesorhizobium escarrei]|uniref:Family S15 peptidase n=1 Tax=Mesorhizobium escarrei TaxID=666018 RepID=A0ABN8JPC7_9HYPH|nr:CocE/NonD family hydrolase [Mesorhizobium escarrei]CAH2399522.1 Family S15 peptidase [Mesorhizobium escarrei]